MFAVALVRRAPILFVAGFLGSVGRELGDVLGAVGNGDMAMAGMLGAFLLFDVIALVFSIRACRTA